MNFFLGIDIGSTSSEGVLIDNLGEIRFKKTIKTKPKQSINIEILNSIISQEFFSENNIPNEIAYCVGTGYGRNNIDCADSVITEITCHAEGAHYFYPGAKTVIDIGGQDSKIIRINDKGEVIDFVMNDKCAAGCGRFLERVSRILRIPINEIGSISKEAAEYCKLSSICAVFAESEIVSKLAEGIQYDSIVKGVHHSVVSRVLSMGKRIGIEPPIVFSGGVAENIGVREEIINQLMIDSEQLKIPDDPKIIGALGAALLAKKEKADN